MTSSLSPTLSDVDLYYRERAGTWPTTRVGPTTDPHSLGPFSVTQTSLSNVSSPEGNYDGSPDSFCTTAPEPDSTELGPPTSSSTPSLGRGGESAGEGGGEGGGGHGGCSGHARKTWTRKNAWGNLSYAELIGLAISSSPEGRLTLAQIYEWIVQNIEYFGSRADSTSSAGWKNSIRHNLSLHDRFIRIVNEGAGKSSWWILNPDTKPLRARRRRAATLDSATARYGASAADRKRRWPPPLTSPRMMMTTTMMMNNRDDVIDSTAPYSAILPGIEQRKAGGECWGVLRGGGGGRGGGEEIERKYIGGYGLSSINEGGTPQQFSYIFPPNSSGAELALLATSNPRKMDAHVPPRAVAGCEGGGLRTTDIGVSAVLSPTVMMSSNTVSGNGYETAPYFNSLSLPLATTSGLPLGPPSQHTSQYGRAHSLAYTSHLGCRGFTRGGGDMGLSNRTGYYAVPTAAGTPNLKNCGELRAGASHPPYDMYPNSVAPHYSGVYQNGGVPSSGCSGLQADGIVGCVGLQVNGAGFNGVGLHLTGDAHNGAGMVENDAVHNFHGSSAGLQLKEGSYAGMGHLINGSGYGCDANLTPLADVKNGFNRHAGDAAALHGYCGDASFRQQSWCNVSVPSNGYYRRNPYDGQHNTVPRFNGELSVARESLVKTDKSDASKGFGRTEDAIKLPGNIAGLETAHSSSQVTPHVSTPSDAMPGVGLYHDASPAFENTNVACVATHSTSVSSQQANVTTDSALQKLNLTFGTSHGQNGTINTLETFGTFHGQNGTVGTLELFQKMDSKIVPTSASKMTSQAFWNEWIDLDDFDLLSLPIPVSQTSPEKTPGTGDDLMEQAEKSWSSCVAPAGESREINKANCDIERRLMESSLLFDEPLDFFYNSCNLLQL